MNQKKCFYSSTLLTILQQNPRNSNESSDSDCGSNDLVYDDNDQIFLAFCIPITEECHTLL